MSRTNAHSVAEALRDTLISPNVSDANWEAANVVDTLDGIRGAIKALSLTHESVGDRVADAINDGLGKMARAIDGLAQATREGRST
jgi:hypothetical protein